MAEAPIATASMRKWMSSFALRRLAHESIAASQPPAISAPRNKLVGNQPGPISQRPVAHPANPNTPQAAAKAPSSRQSSISSGSPAKPSSTAPTSAAAGNVMSLHRQNVGAVTQLGRDSSVTPSLTLNANPAGACSFSPPPPFAPRVFAGHCASIAVSVAAMRASRPTRSTSPRVAICTLRPVASNRTASTPGSSRKNSANIAVQVVCMKTSLSRLPPQRRASLRSDRKSSSPHLLSRPALIHVLRSARSA